MLYLFSGYHAIDGPLSVTKHRYNSILKEPLLEAAKQMGIDIVDSNARNQTGNKNFSIVMSDLE